MQPCTREAHVVHTRRAAAKRQQLQHELLDDSRLTDLRSKFADDEIATGTGDMPTDEVVAPNSDALDDLDYAGLGCMSNVEPTRGRSHRRGCLCT